MIRFFKAAQKKISSDQTFKKVIQLHKAGDREHAMIMCEQLVKEYPYDVQFRHRLALLQREQGLKIDLPDIHKLSSKA